MDLLFVVEGRPKAWQRVARNPRTGRVYKPRETQAYQQLVAWKAHEAKALARRATGLRWSLSGRYDLEVAVFAPDARRRDGDNVLKTVQDALTGVCWADDSQIRRGSYVLDIDRLDPRVVVAVRLLAGDVTSRIVADEGRGGFSARTPETGAQARETGAVVRIGDAAMGGRLSELLPGYVDDEVPPSRVRVAEIDRERREITVVGEEGEA